MSEDVKKFRFFGEQRKPSLEEVESIKVGDNIEVLNEAGEVEFKGTAFVDAADVTEWVSARITDYMIEGFFEYWKVLAQDAGVPQDIPALELMQADIETWTTSQKQDFLADMLKNDETRSVMEEIKHTESYHHKLMSLIKEDKERAQKTR